MFVKTFRTLFYLLIKEALDALLWCLFELLFDDFEAGHLLVLRQVLVDAGTLLVDNLLDGSRIVLDSVDRAVLEIGINETNKLALALNRSSL